MLRGSATPAGTVAYRAALGGVARNGHFREWRGLALSSVGIGTYLGREDDVTDALYEAAIERALLSGINVIDSAVNYRRQRSERAVGRALAKAVGAGQVGREGVVVATKGGFLPFDGPPPLGLLGAGDLVGGSHCITPRYLEDQIERSRTNLGLETIDIYYLHNPETQLGEVDRVELERRLRAAFEALETAVSDGCIARYGTATWTGFRADPSAADYLSLAELVAIASEVGGQDHHFEVVQLPYNLGMPEAFTRANQRVKDRTVPVLEAARQLGIFVMASASVHQGQLTRNLPPMITEYIPGLTSDAQRALQFVRSTPGIGTALVGMKSAGHVEENTKVGAVPPMAWEQFQRLFSAAAG